MALTGAQYVTLKAFILADPTLNAHPNTPDGNFAIAEAMNALAAPPFIVWRTAITDREMIAAMIWTEYISRSVGERDAWRFMTAQGVVNAADPNIRQGIMDIFSGPGGAGSRNNLIAIVKRQATRTEKLFAVGVGSDGSPATMVVEGSLAYQDVETARSLP